MIQLLKNIHNKSEQLHGKKVLLLFVITVVVFLPLGLYIGYINNQRLNEDEMAYQDKLEEVEVKTKYYEGKIQYVNPSFYPGDKISFVLVSPSGEEIILLKSKDQKLKIAEGLTVKVKGTVVKTKDGKNDVLNVTEVIIKNATN